MPYLKSMLKGIREMTSLCYECTAFFTYSRRLFLHFFFPVSDLDSSLAPLCSLTAAVVLHNHKAQNKHKTDSKSKLHFQVDPLPSFWTSLFSSLRLCSPPLPLGYGLAQFACRCRETGFGSHQVKYSCIFYHLAVRSKSHVNNRIKKNQQQNIISPYLSIFSPFPKLLCNWGLRKVPLGHFRSSR